MDESRAPLLTPHEPELPQPSRSSTPPGQCYDTVPKKRLLTFSDGLAMVLGLQIGSGIFLSPALVARNVGSEPAALLVWLLAGLLAWACAACYIEMGTRLPVNGGPQEYLAYCFGDMFGFLASWGCIFAVKPCSAAILAIFIADYICDALRLERTGDTGPVDLHRKAVALLVVALVVAVNCTGSRLSNISTKILLASKVIGVGFIIIMGFAVLLVPSLRPAPASGAEPNILLHLQWDVANYSDTILAAMWAYSGWETLAFVGGELDDPARNIPRVINVSMVIVVALSIFANVAYFSALSFDDIIQSTTIGLKFSQHFLGHTGGVLYAVIICLSSLGTLNVKTFTAGRLTQAAAERRYLPLLMNTVANSAGGPINNGPRGAEPRLRIWDFLHRPMRFGDGTIPLSALLFNSILTFTYVLVGDFSALITFIGMVEYWVVFVTLTGLVSLRLRHNPEPTDADPGLSIVKVPGLIILVAWLAIAFVITTSFIRHPLTGSGFALFCFVSGALRTVVKAQDTRHWE